MDLESFNFVEFWPSTVLDLIFQHLSGSEVLGATQVHTLWNDFLSAHSLTCWKNICVEPKLSDELVHLVNSVRRYQHLRAVNVSRIVDELVEIISKPGRKWKSIVIIRTSFENQSQVEAILSASWKTLEHLDLNSLSCKVTKSEETSLKFNFPELKCLRLAYHFLDESPLWINSMLSNTPQLKSVLLANACDENIKNLILKSPNLTKLTLAGRFMDNCFFKNLSMKLPPRIEQFEFNDILSSSNENENLRYFNNFFKSQSKSLKKFETDALLELEEFETAFTMPNLHTLNVKSFHYNREMIAGYLDSLRASQSVEASLKVFNCQFMDQNLLQLLSIRAGGLEELRVDELLANDMSNPAWFPKLKKCQVFFITAQLEEMIRGKTVAERSNLERQVLDGIVSFDVGNDFSMEVHEFLGTIDPAIDD